MEDAALLQETQLTTKADDGVMVYVNGTEVLRKNMPHGTPNLQIYVTAAPAIASAPAMPLKVTVSESLLQDGANVISAEVHSSSRATPNSSFDLPAVPVTHQAAMVRMAEDPGANSVWSRLTIPPTGPLPTISASGRMTRNRRIL